MTEKYMNTIIYGRAHFGEYHRAKQLLEQICEHEEFIPDKYGWAEPVRLPFSKENMEGAIAALVNERQNQAYPQDSHGRILLKRNKKPHCLYISEWSRIRLNPFGHSFYHIEERYIKSPANLAQWIRYSLSLLPVHEAWFASLSLDAEKAAKNQLEWIIPNNAGPGFVPGTQALGFFGKLHESIPGVYYGNYFGPFYVEWFGREKFENLPCVEKRILPTGGVFFTTAETPWDWDTPQCCQLQRQVVEHLGADVFFDMERLRHEVAEKLGKGNISDPTQLVPRCRVPEFPFEWGRPPQTWEEQKIDIIKYQESLGLKLVEERDDILVFQGKGKHQVEVRLKKGKGSAQ